MINPHRIHVAGVFLLMSIIAGCSSDSVSLSDSNPVAEPAHIDEIKQRAGQMRVLIGYGGDLLEISTSYGDLKSWPEEDVQEVSKELNGFKVWILAEVVEVADGSYRFRNDVPAVIHIETTEPTITLTRTKRFNAEVLSVAPNPPGMPKRLDFSIYMNWQAQNGQGVSIAPPVSVEDWGWFVLREISAKEPGTYGKRMTIEQYQELVVNK